MPGHIHKKGRVGEYVCFTDYKTKFLAPCSKFIKRFDGTNQIHFNSFNFKRVYLESFIVNWFCVLNYCLRNTNSTESRYF